MVKDIVKQWEKNKGELEAYFKNTKQDDYDSYEDIVKQIFNTVLVEDEWDLDKMTVIDDGDYQGTKIFIVPKKTYQPSIDEYVMTHTYYGSCSGCDTLQSISQYDNEVPTEEQLKDYMMLALHLIQRMKVLDSSND